MATQYASAAHAVYDTFATSYDHETFGIALLRGLNRHPSSLEEAAWWVELCAQFTKLPSTMRAAKQLRRFAGRTSYGDRRCGKKLREAYATAMQDVLQNRIDQMFPNGVRGISVDARTVLTSEISVSHLKVDQSIADAFSAYLVSIMMASIGATFIEQLQARGIDVQLRRPLIKDCSTS